MNINEITNFYKEARLLEVEVDKAIKKYSEFLITVARKHFHKTEEDFKSTFDDELASCCAELLQVGEFGVIESMVYPKIRVVLDSLECDQIITRNDRLKIEFPSNCLV